MRHWFVSILALAAAALVCGCGDPAPRPTASVTNSAFPTDTAPAQALPKLPTLRVWLGAQEIVAELALTHRQQEIGMMFRTNIAEGEGMLFVFAAPGRAAFWMTNVPISLSCAYIGSEGEILEIHEMKAQDPTPIVASSDQIQYVLETKHGWFERNNVGIGTVVRTEHGSMPETFLGRRPRN